MRGRAVVVCGMMNVWSLQLYVVSDMVHVVGCGLFVDVELLAVIVGVAKIATCGASVAVACQCFCLCDITSALERSNDEVVAEGLWAERAVVCGQVAEEVGRESYAGPIIDDVCSSPSGDGKDAFAGFLVVACEDGEMADIKKALGVIEWLPGIEIVR